MTKETKKSKVLFAVKIIAGLLVLSFVLSLFMSLFVDDGIENLDGNVALIKVTGPIVSQGSDSFFGEKMASADDLTKLIRKANEDDKIKAIVLEINSPGGSAVASDEIAIEVKKSDKPTVAWIREIGTSGAYWIASSSDYIIANRMSITGSIGVIASYLGFAGLIEEYNVSYQRLVSGKHKDMGSPFKEMTAEEEQLFDESLTQIHDYFIEEVATNRGLTKSDVKKAATGRFFLGVEAKEMNLVDELGSRDEVLAYLEQEIGEEPDFVTYKVRRGFFSSIGITMRESFYIMGKGLGASMKPEDTIQIRT